MFFLCLKKVSLYEKVEKCWLWFLLTIYVNDYVRMKILLLLLNSRWTKYTQENDGGIWITDIRKLPKRKFSVGCKEEKYLHW